MVGGSEDSSCGARDVLEKVGSSNDGVALEPFCARVEPVLSRPPLSPTRGQGNRWWRPSGPRLHHVSRTHGCLCRFAACVTVLVHGLALAQDPLQNKSVGAVVLLPPTAQSVGADPPPAGTLHLPGREYRAGSGWWALACDGACTLAPLQLAVSARQATSAAFAP